ncbi:MAG: hypothetical protein COA58_02905 [Bacteroidetes bacterium]|nr:MAG: hypothetical protein COA58_02905 [Bacteroidota bacterium]
MGNKYPKFAEGDNFEAVHLKRKTKQVFKGDKKGEDYEMYEGSFDIGGGKMITLSFYVDQAPYEDKSGEERFVVNAKRWKSDKKAKGRKTGKAW